MNWWQPPLNSRDRSVLQDRERGARARTEEKLQLIERVLPQCSAPSILQFNAGISQKWLKPGRN